MRIGGETEAIWAQAKRNGRVKGASTEEGEDQKKNKVNRRLGARYYSTWRRRHTHGSTEIESNRRRRRRGRERKEEKKLKITSTGLGLLLGCVVVSVFLPFFFARFLPCRLVCCARVDSSRFRSTIVRDFYFIFNFGGVLRWMVSAISRPQTTEE